MLDNYLRRYTDRYFYVLGSFFSLWGICATHITLLGGIFALLAAINVVHSNNVYATVFYLMNRFCDGLDGGIARNTKLTDIGGFLDIVFDFISHSIVVVAFALRDSAVVFPVLYLLCSFIGATTTFLSYAIIAAKRSLEPKKRRTFCYLGGISEGAETLIFLTIMIFAPSWVTTLAIVFGTMCWLTTLGRIIRAWIEFC